MSLQIVCIDYYYVYITDRRTKYGAFSKRNFHFRTLTDFVQLLFTPPLDETFITGF